MPPLARRPSPFVLFVALVALASLASCRRVQRFAHRHSARGRAEERVAEARIARGHVLYNRYCALCHRGNAQGYAADHANAIGNADFLAVASDAFIRRAIAEGHVGTPMSAWSRRYGGPLDDAMIDAIVAYVRTYATGPVLDLSARHAAGSAERGAVVWNERCVSCHGARGGGTDRATSLSHPTFERSASDGFIRYTIEHGRRGTNMAPFASLGAQSIDDLVAFIRTLEHLPGPPPPPQYEPPPGLDHLILNPTGRPPEFTLREDRYVPAADVARALAEHRRMVILDARATSDWSRNHIAGALPFPFYNIEQMTEQLPHDGTWILAYCACPHAASGHVVDELRRRHFEHTAVIDEGIMFWLAQGYPSAQAAIVGPAGASTEGAAGAGAGTGK